MKSLKKNQWKPLHLPSINLKFMKELWVFKIFSYIMIHKKGTTKFLL